MIGMKAKNPVICTSCGRKDQTDANHIGTDSKMRCQDCGDPYARLCRYCCPSGHGTRWEGETPEVKKYLNY